MVSGRSLVKGDFAWPLRIHFLLSLVATLAEEAGPVGKTEILIALQKQSVATLTEEAGPVGALTDGSE